MLIIGTEVAREAGAVVQCAESIAGSGATAPAWLAGLPVIGARLSGLSRTYVTVHRLLLILRTWILQRLSNGLGRWGARCLVAYHIGLRTLDTVLYLSRR